MKGDIVEKIIRKHGAKILEIEEEHTIIQKTGSKKDIKVIDTQTEPEGGGGKPPVPPTPTPVPPGGDGKRKGGAFNKIKKFARENPVASLALYDIGKGILGKIMKANKAVPGVVGGTVGRRSARGGGGL